MARIETKGKRQENKGWEAKATGPYCDGVTTFIPSEWKTHGGATDRSELSVSPMGGGREAGRDGWMVSRGMSEKMGGWVGR